MTVVCALSDLLPDRGAAALLPSGEQVALFRTGAGEVFALSNIDPFSRAAVLSRGIVGDLDGVPVVASPMHKQHFDLRTGTCVEDRAVSVRVYRVRVEAGQVVVAA
ncbi:nitrite reductase small subunit NirD [Actinophytocola gossypii]|uniref:Nitrite reductase small subunit NirD n=1 Tax=Actinophytocola gossypii TaxID=2812003 RepID=A0ABT2JIX0_9PSEU|nr:nitrite reductase small subunit NirD [Actinophytocola gossypii]MCT2587335.1 nitrite reductase small subunit NirD [Actinophytocola gossypii]